MKTKEEIEKALKEVESDERLSYPKATVFENAPLALIQLGLETRVATLKWVLGGMAKPIHTNPESNLKNMECPYSKKECTKVDTSGMDKISCEKCEIFIQYTKGQNDFMMCL